MRQHTIQTPYVVGEVHCYSTEINGELVLFDCGPPTPEAFAALKEQLDLSRLKYLFITHCHIDHFGLAARLRQETGARVLIPRADDRKIRLRHEYLRIFTDMLTEAGCDRNKAEHIRDKMTDELALLPPESYEVVEDSDLPSRLGISWLSCPGHSQSDLVYLYEGHAVTGDILLRNIYQVPIYDVDLTTMSARFHNYDAYCASICRLSQLRGLKVHPGHRWHIEGVDETILWYVRKVLLRAQTIRSRGSDEMDVMLDALNGSHLTNPFLLHMKLSEAIFTRDFLQDPDKLKGALVCVGLFEQVRGQYHAVLC